MGETDEVPQIAPEPVELPDNEHVVSFGGAKRAFERGPVDRGTGDALVLVDALASRRLQGLALQGEILFFRRYTGVADLHGPHKCVGRHRQAAGAALSAGWRGMRT